MIRSINYTHITIRNSELTRCPYYTPAATFLNPDLVNLRKTTHLRRGIFLGVWYILRYKAPEQAWGLRRAGVSKVLAGVEFGVFFEDGVGLCFSEVGQPFGQVRVGQCKNLDSKDGGIFGTGFADGH